MAAYVFVCSFFSFGFICCSLSFTHHVLNLNYLSSLKENERIKIKVCLLTLHFNHCCKAAICMIEQHLMGYMKTLLNSLDFNGHIAGFSPDRVKVLDLVYTRHD